MFVFNHEFLFPPRTEETLNSLPNMGGGFLNVPDKPIPDGRSREGSNTTADDRVALPGTPERSEEEESVERGREIGPVPPVKPSKSVERLRGEGQGPVVPVKASGSLEREEEGPVPPPKPSRSRERLNI